MPDDTTESVAEHNSKKQPSARPILQSLCSSATDDVVDDEYYSYVDICLMSLVTVT